MLLLPDCNASDALQLAEKLRAVAADQPFPVVGTVTISLGVAELQAGEPTDNLFKRVDIALYEAKAAGRNTARLSALLQASGSADDGNHTQAR